MLVVDDYTGEVLGEVKMTSGGRAVVATDDQIVATTEGLLPNTIVRPDGQMAAAVHAIPAAYRGEGQPVGDEDDVW